jgi:starch synthase (maltosyl-transferring)
LTTPQDDRKRVIIEGVTPEIDGGRYPIKRTVGQKVEVGADIFADSHDDLAAVLLYRREKEPQWVEVPMAFVVNDRWEGSFAVNEMGRYVYTLQGWVDHFKTWQHDLVKKVNANQEVSVELLAGAEMIEDAASRSSGGDAKRLQEWAAALKSSQEIKRRIEVALNRELGLLIARYPDRRFATTYEKELTVVVDRTRARFSCWYEMFPRSCAAEEGKHGTFKDCGARLSYIAKMGFDVLYFPPIHPVSRIQRKGRNNTPEAGPNDPGSPWAIGSEEGGHKAVHPRLGTLVDFRKLVSKASDHGLEVALDIAFQCAPDHPYVKEHPEWFRKRPDGSIQYAENPPKKYQDIYPINFETENWRELWEELKSIFLFWIDQGVTIFRVDNPHTKSFRFWEWLIEEVKRDCPEAIFLAEAFTRPKVMYRLAKLGFTQSYTYFAWRNTKEEITEYFTEIYRGRVREFFRPNLWPNTPDILTEYLQMGGRPAFMVRLILAATLGANYGIYGPAFELCEDQPKEWGSEEYLNSEKYELRSWNTERTDSLMGLIRTMNRIRRENPALQSDWRLRFHPVENAELICYSKSTEDFSNIVLVIVNLDPHHTHSGWVELPLSEWGLEPARPFQVHDLLSDVRYLWHGPRNYVEINPQIMPAHVFRLRRRIRTERDFDYFM